MPVGVGGSQSGQGTTAPQKIGWHVVSFANGDTAVVRWNGSQFVWGSLHPPASPITGIDWLGTTLDLNSTTFWQNWTKAISGLPGVVSATLMSEIDHGILGLQKQPIIINNQGKVTGGTSGKTGSEAVPQNILGTNVNIPNPLDAISGLFGNFAQLLLRVLEALVGVALIFLGLQALTGTGGQGMPIQTVKRYAHV
jgi:hypothetical protein